jgi:hypothetical protein
MRTELVERIIRIDQLAIFVGPGMLDFQALGLTDARFNFIPTKILVAGAQITVGSVTVQGWGDKSLETVTVPLLCNLWHEMRIKRVYVAGTTQGLEIYIGGVIG